MNLFNCDFFLLLEEIKTINNNGSGYITFNAKNDFFVFSYTKETIRAIRGPFTIYATFLSKKGLKRVLTLSNKACLKKFGIEWREICKMNGWGDYKELVTAKRKIMNDGGKNSTWYWYQQRSKHRKIPIKKYASAKRDSL